MKQCAQALRDIDRVLVDEVRVDADASVVLVVWDTPPNPDELQSVSETVTDVDARFRKARGEDLVHVFEDVVEVNNQNHGYNAYVLD